MKIYLKIFLLFLILFFAGSTLQAQDDAKMVDKIKKAYEVFNSADYAAFGDFIADDFIDHSPFPGQKPGLEGIIGAFKMMKNAYPDMKITVNDVIVNSSNDKAAVLMTFTGTNKGEMMGMKPTGKSVNFQGIDLLYFKNDKATEHWGYIDTDTMMKQLGMMPEGDMNMEKK
jgi:steroid delta-isomerase-like uncharacterized protein